MRTLIILLCAGSLAGFCGPAEAGSLKGTVQITGLRDSGDAIVFIDTVEGKTYPTPAEHARINQQDMVFIPHVLPVLVGTTVDFLNGDALLHNVFSPDKCAEKFNLGTWPKGQTRSYTFKQPCAATLLCNVHPEMEAFVVVVPTPYYAVTDKSGAYTIANVPDGIYTVKAWHAKRKEASAQVTVTGDTPLNLELKK